MADYRITEAKQLKTNPLLREVFETEKANIVQAWRSATTVDAREACFAQLNALESFFETLYATLEDILRNRAAENGGGAETRRNGAR